MKGWVRPRRAAGMAVGVAVACLGIMLAHGSTSGRAAAGLGSEDTAAGRVVVTVPQGVGVSCPNLSIDQCSLDPVIPSVGALAATPAGDLVAAGRDSDSRAAIGELTATGALVGAFGQRGIVELSGSLGERFSVEQILVRPSGGLILVGQAPPVHSPSRTAPLVLIGLTADGSVDQNFGVHGVVTVAGVYDDVYNAVGSDIASLQADGNIVFTATTSAPLGGVPRGRFVVGRLTAQGKLDGTFARGGIADEGPGMGLAAVALGDGSVVALGAATSSPNTDVVVKLTAAGVPDAQFADGHRLKATQIATRAGAPVQLLVSSDGAVMLVGDTSVLRYTPTGTVDQSYGNNGVASLHRPRYTPAGRNFVLADGDLLDVSPALTQRDVLDGDVLLTALTSTGTADTTIGADASVTVTPAFGGGIATMEGALTGLGSLPVGSTGTFGLPDAVAAVLPDGSIALASGVEDINVFSSGPSGGSVGGWGFELLQPTLQPDPTFGAAPAALRLTASPAPLTTSHKPPQPAWPSCPIADSKEVGLHMLIASSAPGAVNVLVTSNGQRIAQGTVLVSAAPANYACLRLTPAFPLKRLTPNQPLHISIRLQEENLAGNRGTATTATSLK